MNKIVIILGVALLGMGAALAKQSSRITDLEELLAKVSLTPTANSMQKQDASSNVERAPHKSDVSHRVQELEKKVVALTRQLSRVIPASTRIEEGGPEEMDILKSNVDALMAGEVLDSPEVLNRLRDVIREEQDSAQENRWNQRWERRKQLEHEELKKLAGELQFSDRQTDEVTSVMATERDEVRAFFQAARKGSSSFPQARDLAVQRRTQTDEAMRDILDDDQFEAYTKWRDERSWSRRR